MRVLIAVWPLSAHLYPVVATAWALQAKGHEVRVASHPALVGDITAAGLQAVSLGTPETAPDLTGLMGHLLPDAERDALGAALGLDPDDVNWRTFSSWTLASSQIFLPREGAAYRDWASVEALVSVVDRWRPDLVLWDPNLPAAAIAARVGGAVQARLLWGPDVLGWAVAQAEGRRAELAAAGLADPVADLVATTAHRYGVEVDRELLLGRFTVDPTPPGMRLAPSGARTLDVRRIPYSGAAEVPPWLLEPPARPRVAVTLGTTQRSFRNDYDIVDTLLQVVAGVDVEAVATLDDSQLEGRPVPSNMRVVDFVPLATLLPTCSAIVHHGGIGTLTTAIAHGVPQLVVTRERAAAYATNAQYVAASGAGLAHDVRTGPQELAKHLLRVLTKPEFAEGADRLQREWAVMPTPHELVGVLEQEVRSARG